MNFGNTTQGRRLDRFYGGRASRGRNSQQNRLAAFYGRGSGLSSGG